MSQMFFFCYLFHSTAVNHLLHLFCQHLSSVVPAMILSTEVEQIYKKVKKKKKITFQAADSHCWEIMQLKWKMIRLLAQKAKQTLTGIGVLQEGIVCQNWGEKKIYLMSEETKKTTNNKKRKKKIKTIAEAGFTLFSLPPALRLRSWRGRCELLTLNRRIVPLSGILVVHLRVDPQAQSWKLAEKQRRQTERSTGLREQVVLLLTPLFRTILQGAMEGGGGSPVMSWVASCFLATSTICLPVCWASWPNHIRRQSPTDGYLWVFEFPS